MRGHVDPQGSMFSYFSPESRVPAEHPLRAIKRDADVVLAALSAEFDELYAEIGRPSIPPERLLKASLRFTRCALTGCSARCSTTTSCFAGSSI